MEESAVSEGRTAHYPPGAQAPKVGDRIAALKDPDRLARLNAGKKEWYDKPLEERQRITAERKEAKRARAAEREAKRDAKSGHGPAPDSAPPTVRSERSSLQAAPPESEIPRPGVRGAPLRGLLDLCEALPSLGQGSCFIQVSRIKPTVSFGTQCAGVQKPLWGVLDDAEFAMFYGGGEYVLRGYTLREDGRSKALTETVTYKVPGNPNLESALTEEDAMRPQAHVPNGSGNGAPMGPRLGRPGGGVVTPHVASAEAEMFDRRLTHEETMDERRTRQTEARRQREEADEQAARRQQTETLRILTEDRRLEAERTREIYEGQLAAKGESMAGVAELIKTILPQNRGEDTQVLSRQHSAQIQQLTESSKQEVIRLSEQHREEMRRLVDGHAAAIQRVEDQARSDRERADKLVRDTEQRAGDQVREAERRADARVTDAQNASRAAYDDLRTRSEERVRDQNQQWQQRFDDLKEAHAREIRQKDSELGLMRTNLEGNMQVILAGKDGEIKRLHSEVRDAKAEAEKNKDFVGRLGEFEQQAEVLGFSKGGDSEGGGEEDLKTTAIKAGLGVLQQLPQIIQSGADAISKVRNPGAPTDFPGQRPGGAARGHTRPIPRSMGGGPPPVLLAPLPFATEDGGYNAPPDAHTPPPMARRQEPAIRPLEQSPVAPIQTAIVQVQESLPFPEQPAPAPAQAPEPHAAAPEQQHMSAAPAPASMAPPPGAAATDVDPLTLSIIQSLTPSLASAFVQKATPDVVARGLIESQGIENVRAAMAIVDIDQVIGVIGQDQAPEHMSLKTRNGVKFLREIWRTIEQLVTQ